MQQKQNQQEEVQEDTQTEEVQEQQQKQEELPPMTQAKRQMLKFFLQQWKLKRQQGNQQVQQENIQQEEQVQDKQLDNENGKQESLVFTREEYAQPNFWDDRYKEHKGNFDWYVEWPQLQKFLSDGPMKIDKEAKILMVGCGNSKLSEQMYEDGYQNILSIDISETIVQRMQEEARKKNYNLQYRVMDATQLPFEDKLFDVAIDKGTLDALACGDNLLALKLIKEMDRVCGSVLIISHSSIQKRTNLMGKIFSERQIFQAKVALSGQSELINIIRTHQKGKPISHILKNKEALLECLRQFQMQQLQNKIDETIVEVKLENNQEEIQQQNQTGVYDPRRQSHCFIYKIQ
ncbi:hypothetical protein pb186bvf_004537 [Paramecium bursaria]